MNTADERREIHFSGRVQGVGFRYTTRAIAGRYPLRGFVKNLPDGRVQLVVEGAAEEIDAFLVDLEDEMSHYIVDQQTSVLPATDAFSRFEIRH